MQKDKIASMSKDALSSLRKNAERIVQADKNDKMVAEAKAVLADIEGEFIKRCQAMATKAKGLPESFFWTIMDNTGDRCSRLMNGDSIVAEVRQYNMHKPSAMGGDEYSSYIADEFFRTHEFIDEARHAVTKEVAKRLSYA